MKRKRKSAKSSPIHGRIFELRKAANLTQEQVADLAGVDNTAVCHWETGDGRPEPGRLPKLAAILGTTVDALIEGDARYEALRDAFGAAS